jgi:Protein of unknown function (DUF1697)
MPWRPGWVSQGLNPSYRVPRVSKRTSGALSPIEPDHRISNMPVFIALLRAVNVGGTGKLPMADFKAICEEAGCESAYLYCQRQRRL